MSKFERDALAVYLFDKLYAEQAVDKHAFKFIKELIEKYYESTD
jgi:hypothetical protein